MKKNYDVIVIGASLGGIRAAISSAKMGYKTLLTEEVSWIGGQLTTQAVPPDEHKWIETTGCTRSYREYRNKVRNYYRNHPHIIDELKTKDYFCPGGSSVSRLSHPPLLALEFLNESLKPYIEKGLIDLLVDTKLVNVETNGDYITGVTLKNKDGLFECNAKYYLDGTDTGELIYLSKTEYTIGAESIEETLEPHAKLKADRDDNQPITWVAAVSYHEGEDHTIEKPQMYDYFRNLKMPYDNYNVFSMYGEDSSTGKAKEFGFWNDEVGVNGEKLFGLFTYRRITTKHHFKDNYEPVDITLINWPQNDYFMDNIIETDDDEKNREMAKQLTLSFIYYLQTEVPRKDGGKGYPGLKLRGDVLGTSDGLAMSPYIRESRRIKALFTITEQMISLEGNEKPRSFYDSVGVGSYNIDLHITTRNHDFFYIDTHPFEIPLGSFIPVRMKNLIPACKNIGTTHLTNGCYRLHPVEWNVGEVAGYLAGYSIKNNVGLKEIRDSYLKDFQDYIIEEGVQIRW